MEAVSIQMEERVMLDFMSDTDYRITDEQATAFEEFMRRKRLEAGYARQVDAATAIGVSQDLISRLESRFTPNVRVGEFGRVLQAYSIHPNDAFEVLGLYEPAEPAEDKREYMRKEIDPLLTQLSMDELVYVVKFIRMVLPKP